MGGEERDLRREGPAPPLRLPFRLGAADHDVAELEGPVRLAPERPRGGRPLRATGQRLPEREDVCRAVLPAISAVEFAHRRIVDEREDQLRILPHSVGAECGTDRAARRPEVTRRVASDRDLQRSEAAWPDAGGIRAIRSSGYGIRSW